MAVSHLLFGPVLGIEMFFNVFDFSALLLTTLLFLGCAGPVLGMLLFFFLLKLILTASSAGHWFLLAAL